jgi:hypothetical protein
MRVFDKPRWQEEGALSPGERRCLRDPGAVKMQICNNRLGHTMNALRRITPIRQIARAYSSLLALTGSVQEISRTLACTSSVPSITSEHIEWINASIESVAQAMTTCAPSPKEVDVYSRFGFQLMLDASSLVDRCVIETGKLTISRMMCARLGDGEGD